ncbi:MAG: MFS transporter [Acidimicrobiales bacterium]
MALAPSFELHSWHVVQGVGGAGLINLAVVMIGDFWTGVERTTLIGRNSAVLTVCLALMPSFSGLIASVSNWRWSLACSSLALPIAAFGYRTMPRVDTVATRTIGEQLLDTRRALRQPVILAVIASATLLFMVIFGVFLTTLPGPSREGLRPRSWRPRPHPSAPAIGSTLVAFNLGRIRSRSTVRTVLVASSALISISALAIGIAPTVVLIVVASVIYGLGDGLAIPTLQDVTASSARRPASVGDGGHDRHPARSDHRSHRSVGHLRCHLHLGRHAGRCGGLRGHRGVGFLIGPIDEKAIARSAGAPVA